MLDLHDDPTGTRLTLWLQDIGRIYPRICNFAQILIIFGPPEVSTDPPWCLQMDANMQVSLPGKNKLEIGISAGCVYSGNPKKLRINCCRCVFDVFWARSTAHTSPLASFLIGIAWHNVGPSRCHNRDKMDTVALSYKVDLPQNMRFCPIFGHFLTSRDPQRPSVVPTSKSKYAGKSP